MAVGYSVEHGQSVGSGLLRLTEAARGKLKRLAAPWHLLRDFRRGLSHEGHQAREETYRLLRWTYVKTRGGSRRVLRRMYGKLRPAGAAAAGVDGRVLETLRRDGIAVIPGYLDAAATSALRRYFRETPAHPVGPGFVRGRPTTVAGASGTPRLAYEGPAILGAPGLSALLGDRSIQHLAAAYLGCEPIFSGVNAWWSLADPGADEEALSSAAQLFHFDHDWPAFVKFFFYLTDVGPDDGPFTYVLGTHEQKQHWLDGRVSDRYIEATYGDRVRPITGKAGDLIVADTVGYHKGARVRTGPRLMLQLEFSVARLGAGFQYPRYPRAARPPSDFTHTYDLFCEP